MPKHVIVELIIKPDSYNRQILSISDGLSNEFRITLTKHIPPLSRS